DPLVAEEGASGGGPGQHAEDGAVLPLRVGAGEVEPDPQAARRVDLQLAVLLYVAELRRGGVVEGDDHRRDAARQIQLAVEHLLHRHWAEAAVVEHLQVAPELAALALVPGVLVADQVVLDHHDPAQLVRFPVGGGGGGGDGAATRRSPRGGPVGAGRHGHGRSVAADGRGRGRATGRGGTVGGGAVDGIRIGAGAGGEDCGEGEQAERTAGWHDYLDSGGMVARIVNRTTR